jgi:hypothetical protein
MLVAAGGVGGGVWGAGAQTPPITATSTELNIHGPQALNLHGGGAQIKLYRTSPITATSEISAYVARISAYGIIFDSGVSTTNDGHLHVTGNLTLNGNLNGVPPKAFIHPHPTDASKVIRYVAIESSEALTLARGVAKTVNGEAIIELPEHFSMVTCKGEPITVIATPKGAPVLLYTKQESRDRIVVAMKESDFVEFKDVEFSYQVTGVRDGFEKMETIISVDNLDKTTPAREDVQKRIDGFSEKMKEKFEVKVEE